jgi:DNA-directed RNA polymerase specialized sigma24 family protein
VVLANDISGVENVDVIANITDEAPLPNQIVERPDLAEQVRLALNRMKNELQRRVLEFVYLQAAAYPTLKEVAADMNISLDNAKKLHQRAKVALKASLRGLAQEMNIQTERANHES